MPATTVIDFTEPEIITGTPPRPQMEIVQVPELPIPLIIGGALVGLGLLYVLTTRGKRRRSRRR